MGYDDNPEIQALFATNITFFGRIFGRVTFEVSAAQIELARRIGTVRVSLACDDYCNAFLNNSTLPSLVTNHDYVYWNNEFSINAVSLVEGTNLFAFELVNPLATSTDAFIDAQVVVDNALAPSAGVYRYLTPVPVHRFARSRPFIAQYSDPSRCVVSDE